MEVVSTPSAAMTVVLLALFCLFGGSEAIIEIGRGTASIRTAFFRFGLSVCHQSQVCGVNGKTYQSPCELEDDNVQMACKTACPCGGSPPERHSGHLPTVDDVWVSAPTAIVFTPSPPEEHGHQGSQKSGHQQKQEQRNEQKDMCHQHADPGPCHPHEYSVQYYYDFNRKSCSPFLYGGCEGNSNRFSSRHDCEKACIANGN